MDKIYTPPYLAAMMARASTASPKRGEGFIVADFAAGSGELLLAAATMWPDSTIVATDIDSQAVRDLRMKTEGWLTGICDFTNPRSRNNSPVLRNLNGRTNLVLLNPPFSSRGGVRVSVTAGGSISKCSLGLAFVMNSIDYIAEGGELIAVLPQGSLTSEKDAATWDLLRSMGDAEILKNNGFGTFAQAAVRTAVIRFQKRHSRARSDPYTSLESPGPPYDKNLPLVRIVRGTTQMNHIERSEERTDSTPFLHSTHLQDFTVSSHYRIRCRSGRYAIGPMVLLPRVGQPRPNKVAKHSEPDVYMLSDCVIALMCENAEIAELLWKDLQSNWILLEQEYVGSGARYITNRRLSALLLRLGYAPLVGLPNGHSSVKEE